MSTSWYRGGDLSPENQLRNPLKGRYSHHAQDYVIERGAADAPELERGTATVNTSRQVRKSYGHPYYLLGRADHDIGGEFLSLRTEVSGGRHFGLSRLYAGSPGYVTSWDGLLFASQEARALCAAPQRKPAEELAYLTASVPQFSTTQMLRDGATAVNRVTPTNPLVDLSTSFAELFREGLPALPGRNGNAGSEYLNYQFGIAPLVSDVRDMRKVLAQADALWAQYARNSGKHVRRRYTFPETHDSTSSVQQNRAPHAVPVTLVTGSQKALSPSGALVQPGTLSQHTTTQTKVWFSGAFTYYLPELGWKREMDRLDKLYGLRPGVDTLYQLTPWSWLVDYFTNLGDVIENLNAFSSNGLVMPYAYIMAQKVTTIRSTLDFRVWDGTRFVPERVSDVVVKTSKRRLPATPFGFGLSDGDLTPKQWSILAALGLSRR